MVPANPLPRVHSRRVEWDVYGTLPALCPKAELGLILKQLLSHYLTRLIERTKSQITGLYGKGGR